jgi:hypothetical protein
MISISTGAAVEALWQALHEWERPDQLIKLFDEIAYRLHRNPRFRNMPITEIDLLLADARREFEHDLSAFEWRLVQAFKDAIGFEDADAA